MGCANRGTPSGGEIDTEPPIVLKANPPNYSTNFKSSEIEIFFNEYIRLSKLQTELIVSPPIEPLPLIMPMGSADKLLTISRNYIKILVIQTNFIINRLWNKGSWMSNNTRFS